MAFDWFVVNNMGVLVSRKIRVGYFFCDVCVVLGCTYVRVGRLRPDIVISLARVLARVALTVNVRVFRQRIRSYLESIVDMVAVLRRILEVA